MGQALRELDPRASAAAAFGAALRDRRLERQFSLQKLGKCVLASGALIGKIEKAERRPHADLVHRLDEALCAEGELVRLAAKFVDFYGGTVIPVVEGFSAEVVEERLRSLIVDVRTADHTMAADRLQEVVGHSKAAAAVATRVSTDQRTTLWRAISEAQQLAGWMMFDRGHHRSAEAMFAEARQSAERAKALDLIAYIGGPNAAFMSTWSGNPARGAELAYGALSWAYRSGNLRLAAFVATMAARAHAKMGETDLCEHMLSAAEKALAQHCTDNSDPYWLAVFDRTALSGHRGSCLLDLGNPRQAVQALQEQEDAAPPTFVRNNIIWQLERADANLQLGEIEAAVAGIDQTLDYAEQGPVTPRVVQVFRAADLKLRSTACADPASSTTRDRLREFISACA
ncbi:hypothetical protein GFY24_36860 [Nocardia sp. SYP-A9097]|uniref:helix-turn-helix domain-containing protein n=1 Tax=Nocardia sp. SYP-A9097 TaxID=2663237 RepID=UPI00129BDD1B|nr:helix-turn-helix transcriptional regulator [Nocardia sp. SYP-A9097]MRH92928.1 hypothetical protein [Nocardia sp. SYP-A9097]